MVSECKDAAEKVIPKREKRRTLLPWEDDDILRCRNKVKEVSAKKRKTKSADDRAKFSDAIAELDALYLQKQASYVELKTAEIESVTNNTSLNLSARLQMK